MFDFLDKIGLKAVLEAIKGKIPTSLPANGGNADTVDGKSADDFIRRYGSAKLSAEYVSEAVMDTDYKGVIDDYVANNIGLDGSNSCWWHIIGLKNFNDDGYGTQIAIPLYPTTSLQKPKYRTSAGTVFQSWQNFADGGNANTVGGKSADDFAQIIDFGFNQTDTKIAIGKTGKTTIYRCTNWTDCPSEFIDSQGTLIAINYNGSGTTGTDWIWCTQIIVNPRQGNRIYVRYIDRTSVGDWKEISTTPIKKISFTSAATNNGGGGVLFSADFGTPITIACTSRTDTQCTPFLADSGSRKLWLVLAKDCATLDPIPAGSYSFDVWYI